VESSGVCQWKQASYIKAGAGLKETIVSCTSGVVLRRCSVKRKLRIAFGFPSGIAMTERLQHGIFDYAKKRGGWSFTRSPEMLGTSLGWLRNWPGDGAFIFVTTPEENRYAKCLGIPVVNLSSHLAKPDFPTVTTDHRAIGRMAAKHLLARKFRRLAFYGTEGLYYMEERFKGFHEIARAHASLDRLMVPLPTSAHFRWRNQESALDRWLRKLTPPFGIFAGTDLRASMVLDACARIGLRVPQDVAVLGVDNDPLVCEMCQPSLSSVSRNDFEVGRRAAAVLEALIDSGKNQRWLLVPPDEIVQRESTVTFAVEDPVIAEALVRIQNEIARPFGAAEIAARAPISRRRFEARFRKAVGCSPYSFINGLRIEHAKSLLTSLPERSLTDVAALCGFSNPRRFRLVFQRVSGVLPSTWRDSERGT